MRDHVLIVGAGEFGLSTALALLQRSNSRITIVDKAPTLPNPLGSSVDASRIIRPDYASKPYATLAAEAQVLWRDRTDAGWGGQGRYTETGFVLAADQHKLEYVHQALDNVRAIAQAGAPLDISKIEQLDNPIAVQRATQYDEVIGDAGYANWNSGWANAEKVVRFILERIRQVGGNRVEILPRAAVEQLIIEDGMCKGAFVNGDQVLADLTIIAAGAWSPSLVDLQGRCIATGQALAYIGITPEEQEAMEKRPVVMNFSTGHFIIPPVDCELKIARHGFGHTNFKSVKLSDGSTKEVSVPRIDIPIPAEAQEGMRAFLKKSLPQMADRQFVHTRMCWYCDTPEGDFLIDYHPQLKNLFIATGGSGHGFKFFPVIGDKIVDCIKDELDPDLRDLWRWKEEPVNERFKCEDGSRAGSRELIFDQLEEVF